MGKGRRPTWRRTIALAGLLARADREPVLAATGVCDANPPTSMDACLTALLNQGLVVNDVFQDAYGLTATMLPYYGRLLDNWPGCPAPTPFAGCSGTALPPFDCPGQYGCSAPANTFAAAEAQANALDRGWWQSCRLADPTLTPSGQNGALCPDFTDNCIADGVGGNYVPWEGLVFDLGSPANQVVLMGTNPTGPQPCVSLGYTVFLTNHPLVHGAADVILDPGTQGHDPDKWNRAKVTRVFTAGWVANRPPDPVGHAVCGDTASFAVEMDSFVVVYSLPAGAAMRYAAVVAGNDGLDVPECGYESAVGQVDAVTGLTEAGTAICAVWGADVLFRDGFQECSPF